MPTPRISTRQTEHGHKQSSAPKTVSGLSGPLRDAQWYRFAVQQWLHGLPKRLQNIWAHSEPLPFDPAAHDPDVCDDCNMAMHVLNTASPLREQLAVIADEFREVIAFLDHQCKAARAQAPGHSVSTEFVARLEVTPKRVRKQHR